VYLGSLVGDLLDRVRAGTVPLGLVLLLVLLVLEPMLGNLNKILSSDLRQMMSFLLSVVVL
jgi:F0F1-type ATP synthase assembly protein I